MFKKDPEGGYVAMAPTLPGCHSQGETLEEAQRNISEAIELYIESLIGHGSPVPEENQTFQKVVRIPVSG
ncbi:MAG: type II toxin-antitoxin system HicB family antitoxin [Bryobacteraceae bacterium]